MIVEGILDRMLEGILEETTRMDSRRYARGDIRGGIPLWRPPLGPVGPEEILFQSDLGIPDVLGGEGEEDLLAPGFPETAGKEVEEIEETVLAPVGQGEVLGADFPSELRPE